MPSLFQLLSVNGRLPALLCQPLPSIMYNFPMDAKILRLFIYLFSGVIIVFALLMLLNYVGSISSSPSDLPGQADGGGKMPDADALAQQALAAAKASVGGKGSMIPMSRRDLSSGAVNSQGAIMLVRENEFGGVAEAPKDMMGLLSDLGGGKKKPVIALKESDLDKKINIVGFPIAETRLKVSSMPVMGRGPAQEGITMFTAPVEYKIFKSSETWGAFANSHKCRSTSEPAAGFKPPLSPLTSPDFTRESVIVLISVSELPNGIFKIVKLEKKGKELLVSYRVDPMAMAARDESGQHDFYSASVVPKGPAIKLTQAP